MVPSLSSLWVLWSAKRSSVRCKLLIFVVTARLFDSASEMRILGQVEDNSHRRKRKHVKAFVHDDRQQSWAVGWASDEGGGLDRA